MRTGMNFRNTLDGWFSDDLPDMNQEEPEVARYEIQNALWWIGTTGIDGIRQDTIQYMPRSFIRDLSNALRRQYPKMWMVGEVFDRDAAHTSFFIGGHSGWDGIDTKLDSVFDFPLWNASLLAFTGKAPLRSAAGTVEITMRSIPILQSSPYSQTITIQHGSCRLMARRLKAQ